MTPIPILFRRTVAAARAPALALALLAAGPTPLRAADWTWVRAPLGALARDFAQYPDPRLYRAAALLLPADRPTVPVRFYPGAPADPNVALVPPDRCTIQVNRGWARLGDPRALAAKLAHEQVHIAGTRSEIPAYAKELEVLRRFRGRGHAEVRAVARYLDALRRFDRWRDNPDN